jgi:hypothetical protein
MRCLSLIENLGSSVDGEEEEEEEEGEVTAIFHVHSTLFIQKK